MGVASSECAMGDVLPVLQALVHFATAYSQAFIPEFTRFRDHHERCQ